MTISETLSIYEEFLKSFVPLLRIEDEEGHRKALTAVDLLWNRSSDEELDPYAPLLVLLADAIEKYELLDPELNNFIERSISSLTVKAYTKPKKSI
jgi:phytoene/squalene synthetase|tara:strand:+ start:214 stop:501 length:288 start_codon:yes stop_codon:yes gene_type:complete